MCGRAAQTQAAVVAAAASLGIAAPSVSASAPETAASENNNDETVPTSRSSYEWRDNYNMSPGMDAMVFCKDEKGGGVIRAQRKIWGLVPRSGTQQSPLATGMNQHFSNLMFNARSDTLYSKPTFSRLAATGKTCLIALDGFFEWKAGVVGNKASKKQPYFVCRKTSEQGNSQERRPYLLLAGLWTSVATGRPDEPTLDTFTMLTTEACEPLQWLHTRQPVFVWDDNLATEWLLHPTQKVHQQLDQAAVRTGPDMLAWHAVTPEMSSTKFRSSDSVQALPQMKTVKSFFGVAAKKKDSPKPKSDSKKVATSEIAVSPGKRSASTHPLSTPPSKKSKLSTPSKKGALKSPPNKKGTLESFFLPKSSIKK
jgi:putative SOS response-associated peptidase YedK